MMAPVSEEDARLAALASDRVKQYAEGKTVRRVMYVAGRW